MDSSRVLGLVVKFKFRNQKIDHPQSRQGSTKKYRNSESLLCSCGRFRG